MTDAKDKVKDDPAVPFHVGAKKNEILNPSDPYQNWQE